ncbi:virion structural protein [Synechococcus phage S-B43]|nr:virion structural protein [Synechococcus phage S-B43]
MEVYNTNQLDPGQVDPITTVLSVDSPTQITLSTAPISDGAGSLDFISTGSLSEVSVSSLTGLYSGLVVTVASGTGVLPANTTILSIDSQTNTIVLSADPTTAGVCTFLFSPPFGSPSNSFSYTITNLGAVESIEIAEEGIGYFIDDLLTVNPSDLVSPIEIPVKNVTVASVTFTTTVSSSAFSVGDQIELSDGNSQVPGEVYDVITSGANIVSLLITPDFQIGDEIRVIGSGNNYTIDTLSTGFRYFLNTGSGYVLTPDLTFYVGNTYKFDLSDVSNTDHVFSLSEFRDGKWSPSLVENVSTTLDTLSYDITVASSSGILPGMAVSVSSGIGELNQLTQVVSVNGNTITLDTYPITSGNAVLTFRGVEYTDNVTREESALILKVTDTTPQLYYYCNSLDGHDNEGGTDNNEAVITIDPNNPKVFGSGFELRVLSVQSNSTVSFDIATGTGDFDLVESVGGNFNTITVESSVNTTNLEAGSISTSSISAQDSVAGISVASKINVSGNVTVGTGGFSIAASTGDLNSPGYVFSNQYFNSQNKLKIEGKTITATVAEDLEISPFTGRIAKVTGSTALVIPVGNNTDRPGPGVRQSGAIRFNTETNQYEGYNASTTTWSSLGGVRDIDGNTYILAELNPGDNDNTLWFYNDSVNTLKLTPNFLDFRSVKKISSGRLGLPTFQEWTANTSVSVGQFIKFRNNLYEVTGAGSTATVGSEPTHTSGVQNNGTAQFTWYSPAVSPLSFTEIEELRVAPDKDAPLIVNQSLKLGGKTAEEWNTISTLVEDLTLEPNDGKKVVIKANTHLAIPAGNNNQKNTASAIPGSIRFNTEIQQFEGYSGTNWSSLGGVRDVDGNTYIIPETAPAANENILYFYNDNLNTMQLSTTALDLTNIDTITTSGLNNLSLDTPLVTLNLNDTTIDNRDVTRTFISSSKQYLDLGLSSGLNVDPVLRLDDQGDVYLNTTFGTGTFNGVKVFDGELKEFELADYAIKTTTFSLGKGAAETSAVDLYSSITNKGCKVTVVSKSSSGKRSISEYSVIDDGTDIYHNEFGSLNTSLDQYTASFDYNATNDVRITLTLTDDHVNGDIISFTVLTQVIK